ncbi:Platelet-activating factor acetylhydrolase [Varanus komodoensis]|nr:Platelet-activating factor acetylhydrolase [Varanus komodoensis]
MAVPKPSFLVLKETALVSSEMTVRGAQKECSCSGCQPVWDRQLLLFQGKGQTERTVVSPFPYPPPPRPQDSIDIQKIAVMGHSFGGATVVEALSRDVLCASKNWSGVFAPCVGAASQIEDSAGVQPTLKPISNPTFQVVSGVMLESPRLLVLGDFNIHAQGILSGAVQDIMAGMTTVGLSQHVIGPVHVLGCTLDLVFLARYEDGALSVGDFN